MKSYFVFDVESVGLHGEGFAVGGGVFLENGAVQWGFRLACSPDICDGTNEGRVWVRAYCPVIEATHRSPKAMRDAFWNLWIKAKAEGAVMAADCGWPVEARFLIQCVNDNLTEREWQGPYPLLEIAAFLTAAGMDPMAKYPREASELPEHDPMADARQSARLLSSALLLIETAKLKMRL